MPERFNGAFDLVVGNPPWTRLRVSKKDGQDEEAEKARLETLNDEFTVITQRVLRARGLAEIADGYTNPDNDPDLPFIWRATEWAKPGGLIAMALPARILFKQSGQGRTARGALMRGLAVTGIINGSNLPETDVWPKMKQPFMLFFARNAIPPPSHQFYFATLLRERRLNDRGLFRLDYQAAEPVAANAVTEKPWLLKTLAIGTSLDADIVERLTLLGWKTVAKLWKPPTLWTSTGYILSAGQPQNAEARLARLLDFEPPKRGYRIEFEDLVPFRQKHGQATAHRPREDQVYKPPLIVIPQTPGPERAAPRSFRSIDAELCFSQSYYGFSAAGHPEGEVLVSLLYLITHSLLFHYFCLMVSSRLGAERRTFIKVDLESFPFPDPDKLTSAQKRRIVALAEALETRATKPWDGIDDFIFGLYGLDDDDATVVRDTLSRWSTLPVCARGCRTSRCPLTRRIRSGLTSKTCSSLLSRSSGSACVSDCCRQWTANGIRCGGF